MRSLAKKIDSLNVYNEEDLLEELTEEEREHYNKFKNGLNLKTPKKVVPFWIEPPEGESCLLIYEADGWPMPKIEYCQKYLLKNVPPLLEVTAVVPTYFTLTGLINVLAVYTILYRHYEGQHIYPFAMETTTQLINFSGAFIARKYYVSKIGAIYQACTSSKLTTLIKLEYINVKEVIEDVRNILMGPKNDDQRLNILCALGQIHHMFKECYNDTPRRRLEKSERALPFGPFRTSAHIKPETLEKLTHSFKVIHFYYSYVLSYYSKKWASLKDEPKNYL
uniref:Uncharacterized protein n=2 Tax=Rhodnius prolixus TaxID=13249 RepID=T1HU65_RHOPR